MRLESDCKTMQELKEYIKKRLTFLSERHDELTRETYDMYESAALLGGRKELEDLYQEFFKKEPCDENQIKITNNTNSLNKYTDGPFISIERELELPQFNFHNLNLRGFENIIARNCIVIEAIPAGDDIIIFKIVIDEIVRPLVCDLRMTNIGYALSKKYHKKVFLDYTVVES